MLERARWTLLSSFFGAACLYFGLFADGLLRFKAYAYFSPLLAALTSAGLAVALIVYLRNYPHAKSLFSDAAIAGLLVSATALVVPPRTALEVDESMMLATALAIRFDFSALTPISGVYSEDGTLTVTNITLDKRGVFFPTAVAALHLFRGVSAENSILVNLFCFGLTLFLILRFGRRLFRWPYHALPVLVVVSFPFVVIHARSGTFDTMNLAFFLLTIHVFVSFWTQPTPQRFAILLFSAACLGQIRQESVLIAALALAFALYRIWSLESNGQMLRTFWVTLSPIGLLPSLLRRAIPFDNELPNQWIEPWALSNFVENFEQLVAVFTFGGKLHYGSTPVTGILATLGVIFLFRDRILRRGAQTTAATGGIVLGAANLVLVSTLLLYYHGQPDSPVTIRYFLPFAVLISYLATFAIVAVSAAASGPTRWLLATIPILSIALSLNTTRRADGMALMRSTTNTQVLITNLVGTDTQCRSLVVTPLAIPLLVRGVSAAHETHYDTFLRERLDSLMGTNASVLRVPDSARMPTAALEQLVRQFRYGSCNREITGMVFLK